MGRRSNSFSFFNFNFIYLSIYVCEKIFRFCFLSYKQMTFLSTCKYLILTFLIRSPPSRRTLYYIRSNFINYLFFILFFKIFFFILFFFFFLDFFFKKKKKKKKKKKS